jgi:acyl dehydratase
MAKTIIESVEDLKSFVGKDVGVSDWHLVTQEEVDLFAKATGDNQWIHTDPERAEKESPYGSTIAHGYFTISLAPAFRAQVVEVKNAKMTINYGLNKLRFPAPLPIGKKVRMQAALVSADDVKNGIQTVWKLTFEVEDEEKPACVAEAVYRYMF